MKFNLNDFVQLDVKSLLAVNGGGNCSSTNICASSSGGSCSSGPSTSSSGGASCSSGPSTSVRGGNSCGSVPPSTPPTNPKDGDKTGETTPNGGGNCSNTGASCGSIGGIGNGSDSKNSKTVKCGDYDVPISPTDKYETRKDGSVIVKHVDGSRDCYYPDGGKQYYPAGEVTQNDNPTTKTETSNPESSNPISQTGSETTESGANVTSTENSGITYSGTGGANVSSPNNGGGSSSGDSGNGGQSEENGKTAPVMPVSGKFGQITDGSYADNLTMQYFYKNKLPFDMQPFFKDFDKSMNGDDNSFALEGCKMTAAAKIASELTGKPVDILFDINNNWDKNKDGLLTKEEISEGLNYILDETYGDVVDVKCSSEKDLSLSKSGQTHYKDF